MLALNGISEDLCEEIIESVTNLSYIPRYDNLSNIGATANNGGYTTPPSVAFLILLRTNGSSLPRSERPEEGCAYNRNSSRQTYSYYKVLITN